MTIELGDIALTRLQEVSVDEDRSFVEFRMPGAAGSVFQDLGRGALRLLLRGVLLGEQALRDIEVLRTAHAGATALAFSGDIAVGSEITDVIIEEFEVQQVPGHAFRYEYLLRVREWTEPPAAPGSDLAAVDEEVGQDADQWAAESEAIAAGLDDPGALADSLDDNPGLLARIDLAELAQGLIGALGGLDAADFAHLLASISDVDPDAVIGLIEALGEADSLQDFFEILTDEGINVLEQLTGIDLSEVSDIAQAFLGSIDYVDKVGDVVSAAQALFDELSAFNPAGTFAAIEGGAP